MKGARPMPATIMGYVIRFTGQRVFAFNMGIYKLKYSMNLLMNLMHHFAVATALCVRAGWPSRGIAKSEPSWRSSAGWASSTTRGATS